ncbi:hypothetical protein Leryth_016615, partial [Lithospermum erythrorhizon]
TFALKLNVWLQEQCKHNFVQDLMGALPLLEIPMIDGVVVMVLSAGNSFFLSVDYRVGIDQSQSHLLALYLTYELIP